LNILSFPLAYLLCLVLHLHCWITDKVSQPSASWCIHVHSLLFDPGDGGRMFLRNVGELNWSTERHIIKANTLRGHYSENPKSTGQYSNSTQFPLCRGWSCLIIFGINHRLFLVHSNFIGIITKLRCDTSLFNCWSCWRRERPDWSAMLGVGSPDPSVDLSTAVDCGRLCNGRGNLTFCWG
jgi:hypothetical protein